MSNSSIWPIDSTLSGAATPGQSGPGSNGNEEVHHIPQMSMAGALPSECFASYSEHLLVVVVVGSYNSEEMQSAYSTTPADKTERSKSEQARKKIHWKYIFVSKLLRTIL